MSSLIVQRFNVENHKQYINLSILLVSYFLLRLLFQQFLFLKDLFIFPTGTVVYLFNGFGRYINSEWIFGINETQFVLGASCSGTTFFSLLVSYLLYRSVTHKVSFVWLILAYPITIIANSMRVLSSIYIFEISSILNFQKYDSEIHVVAGTAAFLMSFLVVAFFVEKPKVVDNNGI